ncbi:MAG: oxidoreductase [Peptococcaceae bacterium BRH_c4a]|nr:MAG: oxidoreductase [Peptococcaceae bacterium BRH_c4a]
MSKGSLEKFRLDKKVAIITGGAGLLGIKHAEAIAEAGGIPVLWDINGELAQKESLRIKNEYMVPCLGMQTDITDPGDIKNALERVTAVFNGIDILINNAANDPKVKGSNDQIMSRFENFSLEQWNSDVSVGLKGAFLCSQIVGTYMAVHGGGVILNIASDLGIIAPDQRLYKQPGLKEEEQPVKPVTYSVVKHGLIGLTKYLATYWAHKNIRVNTLAPGGVYTGQPEEFVSRLTNLIPVGRMAEKDEYKSAVLFLVSEASSYMTGSTLIIDGGRTCW